MSVSAFPETVSVTPIPAFNDNYIWCIHDKHHAVVVDPGDQAPVNTFLSDHQLSLVGVLITHHHWDHTDGLVPLLEHWPDIPVFGPLNKNIVGITQHLDEGDMARIPSLNLAFEVLCVPGHTLDHIAYVGHGGVFCGDALFSAGCGRMFEGTPAQMAQSLAKLAALPGATQIYCTHEYTLANLAFALAVDDTNPALRQYSKTAEQQRQQAQPTLPTDMGTQREINPFLRTHVAEIKAQCERHTGEKLEDPVAVFAALRKWKDQF